MGKPCSTSRDGKIVNMTPRPGPEKEAAGAPLGAFKCQPSDFRRRHDDQKSKSPGVPRTVAFKQAKHGCQTLRLPRTGPAAIPL